MVINQGNIYLFIEEGKNVEVQSYLLEKGIDSTDEYGRTALHNAVLYDNIQLMNWVFSKGININTRDINGYSALHFAVQEAHIHSVGSLINFGADVDSVDLNGNTPAMVCVLNWKGGKIKGSLELLYKCNTDFLIKNNYGNCAHDIIPSHILEELRSL